MGFTPKETIHRLVWPETSPWHGFEIDMAEISIGELIDLATFADDAKQSDDPGAIIALYEMLAEHTKEWNLEIPAGNPLEPSVEVYRKRPIEMIMAIVQGWIEALTEVGDPLDKASTAGVPSVVASMPMETLSPRLVS